MPPLPAEARTCPHVPWLGAGVAFRSSWTRAGSATPVVRKDLDAAFGYREEDGTALYYLSEEQAQAILEMRLNRLTALEQDKLHRGLPGRCSTRSASFSRGFSRHPQSASSTVLKEELVEAYATPTVTSAARRF